MSGFAQLGDTARERIAFRNRRAVCLGFFCYAGLYDLLRGRCFLGCTYSRQPTMAKRIFVAADGPDLAGRCSDGFCAPLTARGPRSRCRKASFKAWRRANGRAGGRLKPSREITRSGSSSTFDYLGRTPRVTRGRRLRTQIPRPAAARNRAGSWYPRSAAS